MITKATDGLGEIDILVSSDMDAAAQASPHTAGDVVDAIADGIEKRRFLISSQPNVQDHAIHRTKGHDRWITGMQMLRNRAVDTIGGVQIENFLQTRLANSQAASCAV